MNRKLAIVIPVLLILVGAGMAFDHRFIPRVTLSNNPAFVVLVYFPTVFFAVFTVVALRRGRVWTLAAFAVGLIGTGVFHQLVLGESYANPGYMIPIGHIAAPIVSTAAYVASFLAGSFVRKGLKSIRGSSKNEEKDTDSESPGTTG